MYVDDGVYEEDGALDDCGTTMHPDKANNIMKNREEDCLPKFKFRTLFWLLEIVFIITSLNYKDSVFCLQERLT